MSFFSGLGRRLREIDPMQLALIQATVNGDSASASRIAAERARLRAQREEALMAMKFRGQEMQAPPPAAGVGNDDDVSGAALAPATGQFGLAGNAAAGRAGAYGALASLPEAMTDWVQRFRELMAENARVRLREKLKGKRKFEIEGGQTVQGGNLYGPDQTMQSRSAMEPGYAVGRELGSGPPAGSTAFAPPMSPWRPAGDIDADLDNPAAAGLAPAGNTPPYSDSFADFDPTKTAIKLGRPNRGGRSDTSRPLGTMRGQAPLAFPPAAGHGEMGRLPGMAPPGIAESLLGPAVDGVQRSARAYDENRFAGSGINGLGYRPEPIDRTLLARMIFAESAQIPGDFAAVGWSIMNRMNRDGYGARLKDVLFQDGQFQPVAEGNAEGQDRQLWMASAKPNNLDAGNLAAYRRAEQVADGILSGRISDPTGGATHFFAWNDWDGVDAPYRWYANALRQHRLVRTPYRSAATSGRQQYFFRDTSPRTRIKR